MTSPRMALTTTYLCNHMCFVPGCCATDIYRPPLLFQNKSVSLLRFIFLYDTTYCIHQHTHTNNVQSTLVTTRRHHEQQLRQRSHWRRQDSHGHSWQYGLGCFQHRRRCSRYGMIFPTPLTSGGKNNSSRLIYRRGNSWSRRNCQWSDRRRWKASRGRSRECGNGRSEWVV